MTTFKLGKGRWAENYVGCPYDMTHYVRAHKIGSHLMKCRRNYYKHLEKTGQKIQYFKCRYNPAHSYSEMELRYHEESCPNQFDVLPPPIIGPKIEFFAPTEAELRDFKKLVLQSNMVEEDWEIDLIVNPYPTFEYNTKGPYECHRLNQLKLEATIAMREAAEAAEAARREEAEAAARAESAKSAQYEPGQADEPQPGPSGTQDRRAYEMQEVANAEYVPIPSKREKKVPMRYIFYDSGSESD